MRIRALLALLGLGMMLIALVGCDDNESPSGFTVSGTVVNQVTGQAEPNATVALLQNGVVVQSGITTNSAGQFTISNVPAGTYTLEVTRATDGLVRTIYGPFTVTDTNVSNITVRTLTTNQLTAITGLTVPTNGTASLAVAATDANGNPVTAVVQIDSFTPSAAGNPATLTNITPGTFSVTVTNPSSGQSVVFPNVTFTANTLTVIRAVIPGATTQAFSISGTLTNQETGLPISGASAQLLQNGVPVGQIFTTNSAGQFTITNVVPGTYTVRVTQPGTTFVETFTGPITVTNANVTGINFIGVTTEQLAGIGVTVPTNGTTTVIADGADAFGNPITVTVTVDGFGPSAAGFPAVLTGITPGTYSITITNTANNQSLVIPGVPLTANTAVVVHGLFPGGVTPSTISGTVIDEFTGQPLTGITVSLLQNGASTGQTTTVNASGQFTFTGVPNGNNFTLLAVGTGFVPTYTGPFSVTGNISNVTIRTTTPAALLANEGIATPTNNTATLAVLVRNSSGAFIPVTVSLNGGTPSGAGAPVVLENVTPGTYTVTITDPATSLSIVLPNVTLANNMITLIQGTPGGI